MHLIKTCLPKGDNHIAVRTIILRMAHHVSWYFQHTNLDGFFDKFDFMATNPFIHLPMAHRWSDRLSFFILSSYLWFWVLPRSFPPFHNLLVLGPETKTCPEAAAQAATAAAPATTAADQAADQADQAAADQEAESCRQLLNAADH